MLSVLASYRASGEHHWCLQFGRDDMLIAMMDKIPCTEQWEPCVVLPNGFHMWYPNLRVTDDGLVYDRVIHGKAAPTRIYGGLLTENICQALAFDICTGRLYVSPVPASASRRTFTTAGLP